MQFRFLVQWENNWSTSSRQKFNSFRTYQYYPTKLTWWKRVPEEHEGVDRNHESGPNKEIVMKMYIAIRDSIPVGFAINSASHASLIAYLKWHMDDVDFQDWMLYSFKKVTCRVSDAEFEQLKQIDKNVVVTESALKGEEVAVVLAPRREWPEIVRQLKLYK